MTPPTSKASPVTSVSSTSQPSSSQNNSATQTSQRAPKKGPPLPPRPKPGHPLFNSYMVWTYTHTCYICVNDLLFIIFFLLNDLVIETGSLDCPGWPKAVWGPVRWRKESNNCHSINRPIAVSPGPGYTTKPSTRARRPIQTCLSGPQHVRQSGTSKANKTMPFYTLIAS